jgi:transcriptional regulator with XRE-family HTH domain
MLLSYTGHVDKGENIYTAFIYGLPVKYSVNVNGLNKPNALSRVLDGLSNELDAYLRELVKKKLQIPFPYIQPIIAGDYDIPVSLDLAFAMILRFYRSNRAQKDLAEKLGISPAYLSTVENLEKGVTLEYASSLISKLGLKVFLGILPYRDYETDPIQYSPDGMKLPVLAAASSKGNSIDYDIYRHSGYIESNKRRIVMPFPASLRNYYSHLSNMDIFEVTFPVLEGYGLNFTLVDADEERVKNRAVLHLNLILLGTEKRIKYPKIADGSFTVGLWSDTANKLFPGEFKAFTLKLAKERG